MNRGDLVVMVRVQDLGSERLGLVMSVKGSFAWVIWHCGGVYETTRHLVRDIMEVTEENEDEIAERSNTLSIRP
jgi:hypothetical protein